MTDGEFPAGTDPELAAQALLGPIFYQRLMTSEPFDPNHVEDLIEMIVDGRSRNRPHPGQPTPLTLDSLTSDAPTSEIGER